MGICIGIGTTGTFGIGGVGCLGSCRVEFIAIIVINPSAIGKDYDIDTANARPISH